MACIGRVQNLKTLNNDRDLASPTTNLSERRGRTASLRRVAVWIVLVPVVVGCGRKPTQGLFDLNAPVEIV